MRQEGWGFLMRSRFQYVRAGSVRDAIELQAARGPGARFLAGGTDLYLDWRAEAAMEHCIDLSHLRELAYLRVTDGVLHIGALTSLWDLEASPLRDYASRVLATMATVMCTPQTRSLATVGGNLCNASPAADLPPLLACLDASVSLVGREGARAIPVSEVWRGVKQNNLSDGEIVTGIAIPLRPRAAGAVRRAVRTKLDIAQVIVAAVVGVDGDGVIDYVRVGLGSVAPVPLRAAAAERLLVGRRLADMDEAALQAAAASAAEAGRPIDDVRTSAAYRKAATATLTHRALAEAVTELRAGDGDT